MVCFVFCFGWRLVFYDEVEGVLHRRVVFVSRRHRNTALLDTSVAGQQRAIAEIVARHYDDPYGFVKAIFPWGQQYYYDDEGNAIRNPLNQRRIEDWQKEELIKLGE